MARQFVQGFRHWVGTMMGVMVQYENSPLPKNPTATQTRLFDMAKIFGDRHVMDGNRPVHVYIGTLNQLNQYKSMYNVEIRPMMDKFSSPQGIEHDALTVLETVTTA